MGANQSSTSGASAQSTEQVKTSYYELLGLTRQATEDEIKKAYRRKALELHPDRNYGDVERTTALFAEVQAAYEVLSDPQERAWYDSHEATILRGGDVGEEHYQHNVRVTSAEEIMGMTAKFNSRIDFSDKPSGFFGYLRDVFERLAKEEEVAADWDGLDIIDYPTFGHKDDEYDDVVKDFYAVWVGFSTKKTFAWLDKYRLSDAPNRQVRRLMEKENQQARDQGIREFNDAVRALVTFVRKRDPRYTPNSQTEEDRQKALKDAAAAQRARARAANEEKLKDVVPEWTKIRDPEELEESEEEEVEELHFECVACGKLFKSEKQYDAHEKSKKHQKAIHALRKRMQKENKHLDLDDEMTSSGVVTPMSDSEVDVENIEEPGDEQLKSRPLEDDAVSDSGKSEVSATQPPTASSKTQDGEDNESGDSDYASADKISARLAGLDVNQDAAKELQPDPLSDDGNPTHSSTPKLGKAAQKRAKKAAKAAAEDQEESKFKCAMCNAAFPSKTRLFQHIKDFGHAALKTDVKKGKAKGKR